MKIEVDPPKNFRIVVPERLMRCVSNNYEVSHARALQIINQTRNPDTLGFDRVLNRQMILAALRNRTRK